MEMDQLWQDAKESKRGDLVIARLSPLWAAAVEWLRSDYLQHPQDDKTMADFIRVEIAADPKGWIAPYHFFWGMTTRNALRQKGFGEQEFGIINLDNVYVTLIEEAVR